MIDSQYEFVTALLDAQYDLVKAVAEDRRPRWWASPPRPAAEAKATKKAA